MSLLGTVSRLLADRGIDHAVIGAAALAAHGVARATSDLDLLVVDSICLGEAMWASARAAGAEVEIRMGDDSDPLAGVVRLCVEDQPQVDLVVGRASWQRAALARSRPRRIGDETVPVVEAGDLVLLKLFAGGPQDCWDVDQLLDANPDLAAEVEPRLSSLPTECAALFRRILAARGA